jgi:hypothetical protein
MGWNILSFFLLGSIFTILLRIQNGIITKKRSLELTYFLFDFSCLSLETIQVI